jgi:hypothetical protein
MEDAETLKEILADIGVMKLQSSLEFLSGNIGQGAMATLASTVGAAM